MASVARRPDVAEQTFVPLAAQLACHEALDDVLVWCRGQVPPREAVLVVEQDEYAHDLVVELGEGLHAVYAVT